MINLNSYNWGNTKTEQNSDHKNREIYNKNAFVTEDILCVEHSTHEEK